MFEILSTVALTVSASIVVGFLSVTLAKATSARAAVLVALGAWFVLILAFGATAALGPAGGGAPALGLAVVLPVAALASAYFALPSVRNAMATTPLPALIAVHAIRVLGVIFLVLYADGRLPAPFAPSAGWGDVLIGATALPSPGQLRGSANACDRSSSCGTRSASPTFSPRSHSGLCRPWSTSDFRRTAGQFANDQLALAHHPRLSGANPVFHSHRHLRSAACQVSGLGAGAGVGRR